MDTMLKERPRPIDRDDALSLVDVHEDPPHADDRRRFVAMTLDCAHAIGYRHHVTSTCDTALARFRAA